jgi:xylulokinase
MYVLGVDFGGGSTKATLLDEAGTVVSSCSSEYPSICSRPLFIEQDPLVIYRAFVENIRKLLQKSSVSPEDISVLCLDGGTHIAVLMDGSDRVIRPAIYWSDGRSEEECVALTSTQKKEITKLSCNIPTPTWTLPQLLWIKHHEPENFCRIRKIRFLKDYIRFRLTGDFVTDSIEAIGSMLDDVHVDEWSTYLCNFVGLDCTVLPEIVSPLTITGTVSSAAAEETGLSVHTKVLAGSTDTVMEILASGAVEAGDATIKLATAGRICVISPKPVVSPFLVTYKHLIKGLWYPGTATKTCAASLRWFRDTFFSGPSDSQAYQKIDALAQSIAPGSDKLFFHPYLQGELTPYQDTALRASFTGITSAHTYAHFCRSILEGVAYSLKDCMDSLVDLGLKPTKTLRIIGGGSRSPLWCQIVSDVLELPLIKVLSDDSSIGSGMLAGIAAGNFSSYFESVSAVTKTGRTIYPDSHLSELYQEYFSFYKRIVLALQKIYQEMAR